MTNAIEIKGLGKRYRRKELGSSRYRTLRESMSTAWWKTSEDHEEDYFWALRDVDLSISQGDVLGIIGPNGAGKSTLLKLLSRVTGPTEGSFTLRGRVASLLEVGTGFHPELTGRENIYLSGAIMGMRRTEIKKRFDEIVAFSGVEQFLDMPVKRYSSGMYVRLGFAVAAHLEAEIMLVDEVLAVGDAEFQKKCLGKIGDVAKGGRTVLFVSHNLGAVQEVCETGLLVDKGKARFFSGIGEALNVYLNSDVSATNASVYFFNAHLSENSIETDDLEVVIHLKRLLPDLELIIGIVIRDERNIPIIGVNNDHYFKRIPNGSHEELTVKVYIPQLPLLPGKYTIDLFLDDRQGNIHEEWTNALFFNTYNKANINIGRLNDKLNKVLIKNIAWKIIEE